MALLVKSLPAKAGDLRDAGSTLGSGRSPGGGHATHSSILARRIPWTEESGGLWSKGSQRVEHDRSDFNTACTLVLKAEITNVPMALPNSVTLWCTVPACLMENMAHTSELLSTQCPTVNWLDLESEINLILRKSYPKRLICVWSEVLIPTMQNSPSLPRHVKELSWEQPRLLIQRCMRIIIWATHVPFCLFISSRIRKVKRIIMHTNHEPRKHYPEFHNKSILK